MHAVCFGLYLGHPQCNKTLRGHFLTVYILIMLKYVYAVVLVKTVPLQAWSGPEGSSKLRFPHFMTTAQVGGKVVSLTHRPPLPPGNAPGIQGHSAIERILFQ